jgi:hypothetical protein
LRLQGNPAVQTSAKAAIDGDGNDDIVVDRTIARGHWPWCVLVLIVRFRAKTHAPLVESDDVSRGLMPQLFVAFECPRVVVGLEVSVGACISSNSRAVV